MPNRNHSQSDRCGVSQKQGSTIAATILFINFALEALMLLKTKLFSVLLATIMVTAGFRALDAADRKPGPRKVVVGTLMYNMFHQYPGLDARLKELGNFIDQMAQQAKATYPGSQLDIVALPENAVNGNAKGPASLVSLEIEGPVLDAMGAKAREHNCYIAVPLYLVDDREKGQYSNAVVLLDRKGEVMGTYRKVFPVAARDRDELEGGVTPGNEFPVFDCDFGRVGIQICFDISYDDGWEALGRNGAELVLWPTQSPGRIKPAFRAMQNDYYILTSTWRNNASLLDPTGHNIREITGEDSIFVQQIDLDYIILPWQPSLQDGKILTDKYGDRVGYRYSRAEDSGIFWSNDPSKPISEMVRELDLELPDAMLQRNRKLHERFRQGSIKP
jgi:predicted amidohydrolase